MEGTMSQIYFEIIQYQDLSGISDNIPSIQMKLTVLGSNEGLIHDSS